MKPQLLSSPIDVANYLDDKFGVSKEQMLQIVQAGVSGRNSCTANHPGSMPGIMCWGEATRQLRDIFLPQGYEKDDTDNIPSVYHKERKIKIAVCNSSEETGLELGHPQPVRTKGDGAKRAVFPNEGVFTGILVDSLNAVPTNAEAETFWYLCIFCEEETFRAELLCPILKEDGSFKDFHKRVILVSEGDANGGVPVRRQDPDNDQDSGFEIPVTRKQSSA